MDGNTGPRELWDPKYSVLWYKESVFHNKGFESNRDLLTHLLVRNQERT